MTSNVSLAVNGKLYRGWKSVQITRTIESLSGSCVLDVSDRWAGQVEPWPIREEDECQVMVDEETVLDGYISRRNPSFNAESKTFSYVGLDRAAELVVCSVVLDKWTFRNMTVVDIARRVADEHDIKVSVQPGLELLKAPRKVVVSPGDTAWEVISTAAASAGVMVVSDSAGGIRITRAGTERASQTLIEGHNIIAGSGDFDTSERFYRYIVASQFAGSDNAHGVAARSRAVATDEGVRRRSRAHIIRPAAGVTAEYARQLADWEARSRAARSGSVSITVPGWRQSNGKLWPLNAITRVKSPTLGVDADMLISQADHMLGEASGETTTLRLVRPDAFTPEPRAKVKASQ